MAHELSRQEYAARFGPTAGDRERLGDTDLLALMLAFFVLVFSMSQIRLDAWESLVEAMTDRLSPREEWPRWSGVGVRLCAPA